MSNSHKDSNLIPYSIIGVFLLFGIMVFVMVFGAFQQDVNLVRTDYYAQEVVYDTRIQEIKRTSELGEQVKIDYIPWENQMQARLPKNFDAAQIRGEYWFYRPSDNQLDFKVPLALSVENTQILNLEKIQKGLWRVELSFTYNDQKYFKTHQFTVKNSDTK